MGWDFQAISTDWQLTCGGRGGPHSGRGVCIFFFEFCPAVSCFVGNSLGFFLSFSQVSLPRVFYLLRFLLFPETC